VIHENKSIHVLTAEIEAAFSLLRKAQLPAGLEPLRYLAPPKGLAAKVLLQYKDGRKINRKADACHWNPQTCEAIVSFQLEDDDGDSSDSSAADEDSTSGEIESFGIASQQRDLILALDAAERDVRFVGFVGLKAFRDQFLASRGLRWATDPEARHYELARAINSGLVLRTSVPNPNRPDFPTTAVKVNREHPLVKDILREADSDRVVFKPAKIRGKPLSSTIIEERR
jgi:hypothetical protein